jgi:hypothetical protein
LFFTKSRLFFHCIYQPFHLILLFDQTLKLEMVFFFIRIGRWLNHVVFFGLFLGMAFPGYSRETEEDPLYEKVNRNEWIRKADSLFTYPEDYIKAEKYYKTAIQHLKPEEEELLAYCYI